MPQMTSFTQELHVVFFKMAGVPVKGLKCDDPLTVRVVFQIAHVKIVLSQISEK